MALLSRPRPLHARQGGAAATRTAPPHYEPSRRGPALPPGTNIACSTVIRRAFSSYCRRHVNFPILVEATAWGPRALVPPRAGCPGCTTADAT
ncbi:hypothetical protein EVAR_50533_1 [Eumeta japonica]|uniref:Uncharacterized protein n=1 Tax=Eumeta variegata TaxID=151549 RepID=A0A4C1YT89_EUMVA|nr:hypothetical protein EVAR_50533_1 [Eumeta japonica]